MSQLVKDHNEPVSDLRIDVGDLIGDLIVDLLLACRSACYQRPDLLPNKAGHLPILRMLSNRLAP
jgi:hypothetical protein